MISADFIERVLTNPVIGLKAELVQREWIPHGSVAPAKIYPQEWASAQDDPMHTVFLDYSRLAARQRRGGKRRTRWNEYLVSIGLDSREAVRRMVESRRRRPTDPPIPVAKIYPFTKAENANDPLHDLYLAFQREKWKRKAKGVKMISWSDFLVSCGFESRPVAEDYAKRWAA